MKLDKKQTALIFSLVFFLLLGIVFYFIFFPALRQSRLLSKQIKDKRTNLTKMQTLTSEYSRLEGELSNTGEKIQILKNRLFWERDIGRFLNELTRLASDLEIEFVSLKPESVSSLQQKDKKARIESQKGYLFAQVPILVVLRSSYDDIVKFLKRIEETDKFIKIDSLSIESEQRDIYRHNVKMTLSIFVEEKA